MPPLNLKTDKGFPFYLDENRVKSVRRHGYGHAVITLVTGKDLIVLAGGDILSHMDRRLDEWQPRQ